MDSYTPNLNLVQPLVGSDSGTWGGILNSGVMGALDNILGATYSASITSSDVTLTTTQFQNAVFVITGTATGDHNLILPFQTAAATVGVGGKFVVVNNQTGAYNLTVKAGTTGGAVAVVPQGFAANLYSDGTNVGYATNGVPGYAAASNGNPNTQLAGTAGSVNTNASIAYDYTNNVFYLCTTTGTAGSAVWSQPAVSVTRGFDTPANLSFTASVAANILTVTAVAANTATTPTLTNPIVFAFGDSTLGNGDPVTVNATTALSISTFATGASLGATNGVPFRFWIVAFNSGGAVVLALRNCSNSTQVFPLNEALLQSATGISSGATSAGTFYSPNGVTVTNSAFRIVGMLEYSSGLVTAGTYNNPPTSLRLFSAGMKKPGDMLQAISNLTTTIATATGSTYVTFGQQVNISPSASPNLIRVSTYGTMSGNSDEYHFLQMLRSIGAATTVVGTPGASDISSIGVNAPIALLGYDLPGTTAAVTYGFQGKTNIQAGTLSYPGSSTTGAILELQEIMG